MPGPRKPLALTMGEPSGIAGEIVIKAWRAGDGKPVPPFVYVGDANWLRAEAHHLRSHTHIVEVSSCAEAMKRFTDGIPVLPVPLTERPVHGRPNKANSISVISSIRRAVELVQSGEACAVVTNPIHKGVLYESGFKFPGHTEYLAELSQSPCPVMMLATDELRVVPVTVHVSLARAITSLTREAIQRTAHTVHKSLIDRFGIVQPRLAVAGLNPHAGEDGAMGDEEIRIIRPAVESLVADGLQIAGPISADTLFHAESRRRFDAVICMYHDQALIPLKTLDFHHGVNTTLGLPFIRTSPDHGTALDIAGRGVANPSSLLSALRLAWHMSRENSAQS